MLRLFHNRCCEKEITAFATLVSGSQSMLRHAKHQFDFRKSKDKALTKRTHRHSADVRKVAVPWHQFEGKADISVGQ